MDLSRERLQRELHQIDLQGWDSPTGRRLLDDLRSGVVRPVVRASRLTGPAADQAEASAWAAAWDAIRRPTARAADNPAGMVWSAVRRSVGSEVGAASPITWTARACDDAVPAWPARDVPDHPPESAGPLLDGVLDLLVDEGWDREVAHDAIALLAEDPRRRAWRTVARAMGLPAWQVRRLAVLILGDDPTPGLLCLAVENGPGVFRDPAARAAARACHVRWHAGPGEQLAQLVVRLEPAGPSSAPAACQHDIGSRERQDRKFADLPVDEYPSDISRRAGSHPRPQRAAAPEAQGERCSVSGFQAGSGCGSVGHG